MHTRSEFRRAALGVLLLAVLAGLAATPATAQSNLMIVTQVTGRVGNDLYDLADHLQVLLINGGRQPVTNNILVMRLEGDNGVEINSPVDFHPGEPFPVTVEAGATVVLTGLDLGDYFDAAALEFHGLSRDDYYDHGLPPGTYRVCFQSICPAWLCPDGAVEWTAGPPAGCSNIFTIQALEPPYLINPPCGETLTAGALQSVVFTWTPAPGAPPGSTTYELQIVEMPDPDLSPEEALLTATTPEFFRQEVSGTSFYYGPSQPLLEPGRTYAWRVTARNDEMRLSFTNDGHSEACAFTWGQSQLSLIPSLPDFVPDDDDLPDLVQTPDDLPLAPWCTVRGQLRYKFKGDVGPGGLSQTPSGPQGLQAQGTPADLHAQASVHFTDPNAPWYDDGAVSPMGSKPLAGIPVSLVVVYRLLDGHLGPLMTPNVPETVLASPERLERDGYDPNELAVFLPDVGKVLATTVTGADGSFAFQYVQTPELGLIFTDATGYVTNAKSHQGDLNHELRARQVTRSLRVLVDSRYYCSPEKDLLPEPWEVTDTGTLVSFVKSYDLDVTVRPNDWKNNQAAVDVIPGAKVSILRKTAPDPQIPADEGDPATGGTLQIDSDTFRVVAQAVADANGVAHFTRLVRPWNGPDNPYTYAETSDTKGNYVYTPRLRYYSAASNQRIHPMLNSELDPVPTLTAQTWLWPDYPRIFGRVMDLSNTNTPIPGAWLLLFSNYAGDGSGVNGYDGDEMRHPLRYTGSDDQGYFRFDHLDVQEDGGALVGPDRSLAAGKTGYDEFHKDLGIMAWGRQVDLTAEVKLKPNGMVGGIVLDLETRQPVAADVYFPGGISVQTKSFFGAQAFSVHAPSGDDQQLTVVPHDADYAPRTFSVDIPKTDHLLDIGEFPVVRKRHRMQVQVLRGLPQNGALMMMIPELQPLANATVEILGQTAVTDPRGTAILVFDSAAHSFATTVTPPEDADYVTQKPTLVNYPSVEPQPYQVVLPPAARISGTVTVGGEAPVAGARVFVDVGSGPGVVPVETVTDGHGRYTLRGIPLTPPMATVHAVRSSQTTTYVGASATIHLPHDAPVDLDLKIYDDLDITRLLGFPLEITHLVETGTRRVTIDGRFVHLPANAGFAPADTSVTLPFHDIALQAGTDHGAGGAPVAVPVKTPIPTQTPALAVKLFDAFDAVARPQTTGGLLAVERVSDSAGRIRARVALDPGCFGFSTNSLDLGDEPTLAGQNGLLTVLASDPAEVDPDRYLLSGENDSVTFKLFGFTADAPAAQAYVRGDTIALKTTLHADVGKTGPLPVEIDAGWVRAHTDGLDAVAGAGPLQLTLESWAVTGTDWELGAGTNGISCAQGVVDTGPIDVPVTGLHIKTTDLVIDAIDLEHIELGGVAPLEVLTQNAGFGYDPQVGEDQQGHWKLSLLPPQSGGPAARLTDLPGMATGAAFTFQSIDLLSNGEQQIGFGTSAPDVTFYDVFTLTPGNLTSYDDFFEIAGTVDLGIPRLASSYQAILTFHREGGEIVLHLMPIPFSFTAPGEVKFTAIQTADAQTLSPGDFTALGTISEPEGITLRTKLHRTTSQGIWLEVAPADQWLRIGEQTTSLTAITGEMRVQEPQHDWGWFSFSGDMTGAKGMSGDTRKTFTVYGDITADNQSVSVQNIPSAFGGIGLTYDYANARMTGSLEFNQGFSGVHMHGLANVVVDGDGWYFLSGGDLTLPGFGNLQAGMLIGDYSYMPSEVASSLMQFAYDKHVPPGFQNGISGFFFTGRKNIPQFSVPDAGFNLGVCSAHFGGDTGLDGRVWTSFDGPGTEIGIGAMAFVNAHFIMSSITCTSISGGAGAEMGAQGILNTNGQFTLSGCGSLTVHGSVEQCVPTPTWDGIDCKFCAGISVSKSLKITMDMGSSGVNAGIGLGTCSGSEPALTSDW